MAATRFVPLPLRYRIAVALPMVLAAPFIMAAHYFGSGGRVVCCAGGFAAPVTTGEEFNNLTPLVVTGGTVELVSARPVGVNAGLKVEVRLVSGDLGGGAFRGPLPAGFEVVPLKGRTVRVANANRAGYLLDLRFLALTGGVHKLAAVEVTYRAGFLRTRTIRLPAQACLIASPNWQSDLGSNCPIP